MTEKALKMAKEADQTCNVDSSESDTERPSKRTRSNPSYVESEGNLNSTFHCTIHFNVIVIGVF